jgi:alpha/beta superfamily hydrolase
LLSWLRRLRDAKREMWTASSSFGAAIAWVRALFTMAIVHARFEVARATAR